MKLLNFFAISAALLLISCESTQARAKSQVPQAAEESVQGQIPQANPDAPDGYASIGWNDKRKNGEVTVTTKADLIKYASKGGYIIKIQGMIDMSDGMLPSVGGESTPALDAFVKKTSGGKYSDYISFRDAYAASCTKSTEDGKSSSTTKSPLYDSLWNLNRAYGSIISLKVASNTTLIGADSSSGIKGGTIKVADVSSVAIRNLTVQDAYDPFPHHENNDGFNAQHDLIAVNGTSTDNIWIDHCTLQDTLNVNYVKTKDGKEKWQTYDGLCDLTLGAKKITVSNCRLLNHDKTMLIGSSDSDGSNKVRLVTLHHNYFFNCGQRLPMVRNTTIHIYNNYYDADKNGFYKQNYAVGERKNALIYAENNYFGSGIAYSFRNNDGKLYASGNIDKSANGRETSVSGTSLFSQTVNAYPYKADSVDFVIENVPATAGAR